ncbi:MAG: AMP-binding protein [Desulfosarcinaceae bacterium]|jgi:long-chain acyl-CoA synthetase
MSTDYDLKPWLRTYPDWLPTEFAASRETVLDKFNQAVAGYPQDPCIYYFERAISFAQTDAMARSLAAALGQMGFKRGDRMLFVLQNIPQAIIASVAVWMLGGTVVPVNPMYTSKDLKHLLSDSGARMILCEDVLYPKTIHEAAADRTIITTSALDLLGDEQPMPDQLAGIQKAVFGEATDFMALIEAFKDRPFPVQKPEPEDIAYLVYTSGTTGPPKGAIISHANIGHNCHVYQASVRLNRSDVILGIAPLFHITGIVAHQAIGFHLAIPVVLHNRFDATDVLRLIQLHRISFTVASITVYIALLNHPDLRSFDLSSFTKAYSGGAPVSPGTVNKFKEAMGLTIYNVYGLTESTSPATITPLGMEGPVDPDSGALSVGLIIPGIEAWIVDVDDPQTEVPLGQEGELVLRGPSIVRGYWQKPEETAKAIVDGRFHTGDVAKIDERGWCYIVDRKKDLINVSGFKVWPRDVEDVLYQHPGVKEAAVVGVPDSYRGETVKAFVSLIEDFKGKTTSEELIQFCKERLAAYKYPRIVEIIDEVPKTMTGKMLRRQLKDQ